MIADAVRCTHNGTGGSGALTLAAVTGYPQPTDAFTSSGTRLFNYEIAEYTDSTMVTLSKYERGIGSLVLSTNVLTRSTIYTTWTSGGSYNMSAPTALSFGNTAANIQILLGASQATQKVGHAYIQNISGDGWFSFNTRATYNSNALARAIITGNSNFFMIEYAGCGFITQVAVDVTTAIAASTIRVGLFDILPSTGGPGNLITEFTGTTQIASTSTGFRAVTLVAPIQLPPGFYFLCVAGSSSSIQLNTLEIQGNGLNGSSSSRDIMFMDKGVTYGAMPTPAPTTWANTYTRSSVNQWGVFYK